MDALQGNVAVVTGAGRGIGRAVAKRFAREGARVAALARTGAELSSLVESTRSGPGECLGTVCDVTDEAAVRRAIGNARHKLGEISILVNNAGAFCDAPFIDTPVEQWRRLLDVNVLGAVHCVRAVLPSMLEAGRGRIVNVCSTASHKAYAGQSAYCASKHALLGLTRVLAAETHGTGVRVHSVSPGGVDTKLVRESGRSVDLGEYMAPAEVADIVFFLVGLAGKAQIDDVLVRRIGSRP